MKLKYKLSSILVSVSCVAFAQLTDTISVKSNSFYERYFTDLSENPLLISNYKIKDFTQTQIEYQNKDLNFKRRQTAGRSEAFKFSTQGIYNYSPKLRVFGNFDVTKVLEDDLGFNFSSGRTENQLVLAPNYFYAPKAGNWDIQKYNLQGGATYSFDNGFKIGGVVNYTNEKHYRKVDPRPEILVHNIKGKGFIGYQYQNHLLTAFAGIGKNTEEAGIMYVDQLLNAPTLEDTFVRFNSGYGFTAFNPTYNKFLNRGITHLWGAAYQFQKEKNNINISYQYSKLLEDLYNKSNVSSGSSQIIIDKNQITHKYRDITHLTKINYHFDGDAVDYLAKAFYKFSKHDNYSVLSQGQNFRYVENRFGLENGILKKENNKTLYAINLGAVYSRNVIRDLLSGVDKKVHYLEVNLAANTDLYKNEKNRINTEIFAKHYRALSEHLVYNASSSNNTFANQVIFNDHGYDVTSTVTTGINVNYDITLKKCDLRIFGSYQSMFVTSEQYKDYTTNLIDRPNGTGTVGLAIIY